VEKMEIFCDEEEREGGRTRGRDREEVEVEVENNDVVLCCEEMRASREYEEGSVLREGCKKTSKQASERTHRQAGTHKNITNIWSPPNLLAAISYCHCANQRAVHLSSVLKSEITYVYSLFQLLETIG